AATVPRRPLPPRPPVGGGRSSQSAVPTTDVIDRHEGRGVEWEEEVRALQEKHNRSFAAKLTSRLAYAALGADPITASGTLDVLRYGQVLKARRLVEVRGAGRRYDGKYYVTGVSHTIERGAYSQGFSLARGWFDAARSKVNV
ncbi:MAG: hypothetical protein OEV40_29295, partial [Acidimicrobiia bacterium]|nr:hypothetical protein [Acidimicrobiia bacterium]